MDRRTSDEQEKKSPWRLVFLACIVYGAIKLLPALWINLYYWFIRAKVMLTTSEAASIGIIGGADGPTAIFVTTPAWMHCLLPLVALTVGIWGYLRLRKCTEK